ARAPVDVPAGRRVGVRPGLRRRDLLPRRLLPERGRAVEVRLRRIQRPEALRAVRALRVGGEAAARGEAAAARLRDDPEGSAQLQPARRARQHLGHRARRLHRPDTNALAPGRAGVRGVARGARLPDAAARTAEAGVTSGARSATLLVELVTEELPP